MPPAYLQGPPAQAQGAFRPCAGKAAFQSAVIAHLALNRSDRPRSAYHCRCGFWHLTTGRKAYHGVNLIERRKARLVRLEIVG